MSVRSYATGIGDYRVAAGQGALAGLAGGLVFGAAMAQLGMLPTIAGLVRVHSAPVGFIVHMFVAAVLGSIFGMLARYQSPGPGETVFWGLAYGMLWWYLGALTLLPLLLGDRVEWSVTAARAAFPSLLGHLLYGATTALVLAWLRRRVPAGTRRPVTATVVARGALAGTVAAWLFSAALDTSIEPLAVSAAMTRQPEPLVAAGVVGLGLIAGLGYAVLYPATPETAGPALLRGAGCGFLLWVAVGLTVAPLVEAGRLPWTIDAVRMVFPTLPGYLLLGALTAGLFTWLGRAGRLLFAGPVERSADADEEGAGARTLRAVGRGAVAGVVGGLLFTVVMVQIGFLGTVARLVGSGSPAVGVAVHLAISVFIGACYGLLFRRQSHDLASGVGWGAAYGFLWWVLGALTIMPVWLGGQPQWTAQAAATAFPSLVGHLAYGAGLGVTFHLLETRHDPWWMPRTTAHTARAERHRAHLQGSAPAVWVLVVLMALTVTVVLGD
jgi:uncharacterized membrane protein YagU involved in acid resistance